jgi:DNA modification methylase
MCIRDRYLVKMVTPTNGIVLDPFTGSGSTGRAAVLCGSDFIGIEMSEEFVKVAKLRIAAVDES